MMLFMNDYEPYRFLLEREYYNPDLLMDERPTKTIGWIGCNPSTATSKEDDPTIRRIKEFSWGMGGTNIIMTNIIPYRSTEPHWLDHIPDRETAFADEKYSDASQGEAIEYLFNKSDLIICAWGAIHDTPREVMSDMQRPRKTYFAMGLAKINGRRNYLINHQHFPRNPPMMCLGTTKLGHPKHPLYLSKKTPLEAFDFDKYYKDNIRQNPETKHYEYIEAWEK